MRGDPAVLTRWLERPFDASPIALSRIGRRANAFAAIAVIAAALTLPPIGREMAPAVALLPQAQFGYASFAPDHDENPRPDRRSVPTSIAFMLTGGQGADRTAGAALLEHPPDCDVLHGDKGYDSNAIRRQVRDRGA